MFKVFNKFRKDENGAVTVDWVVLTAAVVVLAAGVAGVLATTGTTGPLVSLKNRIEAAIANPAGTTQVDP